MTFTGQSMVAGALAVAALTIAAGAQQPTAGVGQDHWTFTLAPSFLSPSTTSTVQGLSPGYVNNSQPRGGAGLTLEARKGVWSFVLDGLFYGESAPIAAGGFPNGAEVDSGSQSSNRVMVEGFAFRRVVPSLELALGVVGNSVHASATTYGMTGGSGPSQPYTFSTQRTKNWAMPAFAARWRPVDAARWSASLAADVGYWSVNNKSWQIVPSVGYRVSRKVSVLAEYRWMNTWYYIAPGFAIEEFTLKSYVHGPALGVGLHF